MSKPTTLGIEVEFTGMSRDRAKDILVKHFGVNKVRPYTYHGMVSYEITDKKGKVWKIMYDGSIKSSNGLENNKCELVSPILRSEEDQNNFLKVVDELKTHGGYSSEGCAIHVHVGASDMSARGLKNLSNLFYSRQQDFVKFFAVDPARRSRYCKLIGYEKFIKPINDKRFVGKFFFPEIRQKKNLKKTWYGEAESDDDKEDTRYHALNFHSLYEKGTVEFRMFNGTMDTDKIGAYANLCMRMKEFSEEQALISHRDMRPVDRKTMSKLQFKEWLEKVGVKLAHHKVLLNGASIESNARRVARNTNRASNRAPRNIMDLYNNPGNLSYQM